MLLGSGLIFFAHVIPLVVLVILMGLELAVACIQAYVFTILSCIYLNDALNLHYYWCSKFCGYKLMVN